MHGALVVTAEDSSGFDAPVLNFLEQGRGCLAVAIVYSGGQASQSDAGLLPWEQGGGEVFLLAPAIEKGEELVQEAGEDPKMAATRRRGRVPSLGKVPTEKVGSKVAQGLVQQRAAKGRLWGWRAPAAGNMGWSREFGNGEIEKPLDVGEKRLRIL
jgi:hypothetical protein